MAKTHRVQAKGGSGSGSSGGRGGTTGASSGGSGYGAAAAAGGGGAAAGYHHGGRDNNYNSNDDNNNGGMDSGTKKALGGGVGITLVGLLCAACGGFAFLKKIKKNSEFDDLCEQADKEVMDSAAAAASGATGGEMILGQQQHVAGFNYVATYLDSNHENGTKSLSCTGELHFKVISPTVTKIRGMGSDQDGGFAVRQGKLALHTGKAYWIEQTGSTGIRSLIKGTFVRGDPTMNSNRLSFTGGTFVSSNKATGSFTNFEIRTLTPQGVEEPRDVNLVSNAAASAVTRAPRYSHPEAFFATTVATDNNNQNNPGMECARGNDNGRPTSSLTKIPSIFRPPEDAANDHHVHFNGSTTSFPQPQTVEVTPTSYEPVPSATATPVNSVHDKPSNYDDIPTVPASSLHLTSTSDHNDMVNTSQLSFAYQSGSFNNNSSINNSNSNINNSSFNNNRSNSSRNTNYDNVPSIFRPP